jgi:Flp pilus assembly pilin Flp
MPVGNSIRSFWMSVWCSIHGYWILLWRPAPGQTNVEYAFILFLVSIATVVLLIALASNTTSMLSSVNSRAGWP